MLGVPETASPADILSAFRTRIRAVHPDLNGGAGDREVLEVLVRARQTLTGPDRDAYLAARTRRTNPEPRTSGPAGQRQAGPEAEPNLDYSEVYRRAAAARRARTSSPQAAPAPAPPRPAPHVDPFADAASQAERTRDEVRQAVRPTVEVPLRRPDSTQPRPGPVPPVWIPPYEAPRYPRPRYEGVHYEPVRYEGVHYEPIRYEGISFPPSRPPDPVDSFLRATRPDTKPGGSKG